MPLPLNRAPGQDLHGLPVPEAVGILDATKLSTYTACPRKYYYEHLLGLRREGSSIHLDFGSAIHEAREAILLAIHTQGCEASLDLARWAYDNFFTPAFDAAVPEDEQFSHDTKNPTKALEALEVYCANYRHHEDQLVWTEVAGRVPIGKSSAGDLRLWAVRMDAVYLDPQDFYFSSDLKTAGRGGAPFQQQFIMADQMSGYIHALNMTLGRSRVRGVEVEGLILTKGGTRLEPVPMIEKSAPSMTEWITNTNTLLDRLETDLGNALEFDRPDAPAMVSFPRNATSCGDYGGCPFLDLCQTTPNPLCFTTERPSGYERRWWNPLDQAENPAKIMIEATGDESVSILTPQPEEAIV